MAEVLIDSYSESNKSADAGQVIFNRGQSFTGTGIPLTKCKFYLKKLGNPSGDIYAYLYAHTGTFGSTGVPTGDPLATSDPVSISSVSTDYGLITFTFDGSYTLVKGTKYFLIISHYGASGNYLIIGVDGTSPTAPGNAAYYSSSWVYQSGIDVCYYIYGNLEPVNASLTISIKKQSVSVAGESVVPEYDASVSLSIKKQQVSIAGYADVPVYTADADLEIKKSLVSIVGESIYGIAYTIDADLEIKKQMIGIEVIKKVPDTRYAKEAWDSLDRAFQSGIRVFPFYRQGYYENTRTKRK